MSRIIFSSSSLRIKCARGEPLLMGFDRWMESLPSFIDSFFEGGFKFAQNRYGLHQIEIDNDIFIFEKFYYHYALILPNYFRSI
mgnify:CR=1 FL=1